MARRWGRSPERRWPWAGRQPATSEPGGTGDPATGPAEAPPTQVSTPGAQAEAPPTQPVEAVGTQAGPPVASPVTPTSPALAGAGNPDPPGAGRRGLLGPLGGRWLGSRTVAAVVVLLLAAEIGYVIHLGSNNSPSHKAATTTTSPGTASTTPPPVTSTTAPPTLSLPVVVPQAPQTAAAGSKSSTPTTTTPPSTTKPATAVASSSPGYCTPADLAFSTTTNAASYLPGQTVAMTMKVTDVTSCIFDLVAVGEYQCSAYMAVTEGGHEVFPNSSYTEPCDPPASQTMNPGSDDTLTVDWTVPPAAKPAADYQVVAEWGWSAGSGAPHVMYQPSSDFAVS